MTPKKSRLSPGVWTVLCLLLALCLWEWAAAAGHVNDYFFSRPSALWAEFLELVSSGLLAKHLSVTLQEAGLGLLFGGLFGTLAGLGLGLDAIERIVAADPDRVVIVDEAYVDFGAASALPLIEKYDNLLVVQTFSKSRSLAGMRIGYAFGNPELIKYLNDVKYSFNSYTMDRTTIAAGVASMEDKAYFEECCNKIIATREWTKTELGKLGFSFQDSKANFIFATHKSCPAKELFEALREKHIYVRYFPKDRIDNHLRITIGTDEEMKKLIEFLTEYLK